jgi:hypothetical protein
VNAYHVTGGVRRDNAIEVIDVFVVDENGIEAARRVIRQFGITPDNVQGAMRSQAVGKDVLGPARILVGLEALAWRSKRQQSA